MLRASRGRNARYRAPPAQTRTCRFLASGSSVALASARIFTVARYKTQLLLPAVRFARVYPALHVRHEFPLLAACFRQVLSLACADGTWRKACGWLSQPLSTMPDKTPQRHLTALRRPTWFAMTCARSAMGLPEFYSVSVLACHGLMTPADLHILANNGCFCVAFGAR